MDHKSIWNERQNKPTYIAIDLESFGIPRETTYEILLRRGVFKWLAVRRDIIKLKDEWKSKVRATIAMIRVAKRYGDRDELHFLRGYLAAVEECRNEVRALCHSARWRAPDFDKGAVRFLEGKDDNPDTQIPFVP